MKMRLFAHSTCFHVKPRHSEVVAQFKLSHYPLGDADTRGSDQKHGNLHRVSKVTFSRWSHFGLEPRRYPDSTGILQPCLQILDHESSCGKNRKETAAIPV